MYRLPLLNMCSRETSRLPATEIIKMLECDPSLPIEINQSLSLLTPTGRFFVYWVRQGEFQAKTDGFFLVEVNGLEEKILDSGMARAITYHGEGYQNFRGFCEKLKMKFEFYCPLDLSRRGRLKPLSALCK